MNAISEPELPPLVRSTLDRLSGCPLRVLLLDYDGTLAPFRPERSEAVPYPGVREILARLITSSQTRVAIITGRAIDHLIPLLDLEVLPEIWGTHGWEHRDREGGYHCFPLSELAARGLEEARDQVAAMRAGAGDFDARFERKPAGVALHWRGLPEEESQELSTAVEAAWSNLEATRAGELSPIPFDGGLELRATGRTKGAVMETILGELAKPNVAVYLGDDLTDEDAFRVLKGRGLGILVRKEWRLTAAEAHLRPPDELLAFLRAWQQKSEDGPNG